MIHASSNLHIHNRFDLKLIDSATGAVKQTAQAENVVLNNYWTKLYSMWNKRFFIGLALGSGTGTPAATDTGLFSERFRNSMTNPSTTPYVRLQRTIAWPTSTMIGQYTFPATSSYVGNLTEIGILSGETSTSSSSAERWLATHAMLVDSEGNPITINKTELDILIVTVTVYLTISSSDPTLIPYKGSLSLFLNNFTDREGSDARFDTSVSMQLLPYASSTDAYSAVEPSTSSNNYNASTRTISLVGTRLGTGSGNTNFFNGIGIKGLGWVRFPNSNVFAPYTMQGITLGTGDGSKTEFNCPLPVFVKDSDVVYKNGVALTRGTDYTIDNLQNYPRHANVTAFNFAEITLPATTPSGWTLPLSGNLTAALTVASINTRARYWLKDSITVHLSSPDPLVGNKINTIQFKDFFTSRTTNTVRSGKIVYVFEYSTDGEDWSPLCSYEYTVGSDARVSTEVTFDTVNANYIRISVDQDNTAIYNDSSKTNLIPYPWQNVFSELGAIRALYIGEPIKFTVAPAAGDVITMDAVLDRPYKNSNFVVDTAMSIKFN